MGFLRTYYADVTSRFKQVQIGVSSKHGLHKHGPSIYTFTVIPESYYSRDQPMASTCLTARRAEAVCLEAKHGHD